MKAARSSKSVHGPLVGETLEAINNEIEAAGKRLGFDVSRKGWLERASQEGNAYPLVIDGDKEEEAILKLMPKPIRARIQALQQIGYLTEEILGFFEFENMTRECDQAVTRLREAMTDDPAPIPVADYVKQIDKKAA